LTNSPNTDNRDQRTLVCIPGTLNVLAQPARKSSSLGFAAKYAAQPARKSSSLGFAAKYAAQPARKSSSLGFAAKYAAQLLDEIRTPIPIDLRVLEIFLSAIWILNRYLSRLFWRLSFPRDQFQ
jgi:hypothetical protein